jgi:hypothetical protein
MPITVALGIRSRPYSRITPGEQLFYKVALVKFARSDKPADLQQTSLGLWLLVRGSHPKASRWGIGMNGMRVAIHETYASTILPRRAASSHRSR